MIEKSGGFGMFWSDDLYNTEITDKEFRFLCAINNLCATTGECNSGNKYFSEKFDIKPETVTRNIKRLEDLGLITIRYEGNGTNNKRRFIRMARTNGRKTVEPIDLKVNVNNNNINNNISKDILYNKDKSLLSEREINNKIIETIKVRAELKGLYYDKKDERRYSHLIHKDKDFISVMEKKSLSAPETVKAVLNLADNLDFWQNNLLSTKSFYYNWKKVLNEYKVKHNGASLTKELTEDERLKHLETLRNQFNI